MCNGLLQKNGLIMEDVNGADEYDRRQGCYEE
jgi:hypothetical protein